MIISKNNIVNYTLLAAVIIFAIYTRYWDLLLKPIHFDESINGWFIDQILKNGFFKYDPSNYHGPLFFYLQFAFQKVAGFGLLNLRFVTTSFSFLAVLVFAFKKNKTANFLAILLAVSSSAVFYGRSGIHESLFVLLSLVAWWCLVEEDQQIGLGLCCLILAMAVKETWALQVFAAIFAFLFSGLWKPLLNQIRQLIQDSELGAKHRYWVMSGLLLFILTFSGGFKNPHGLLDFFVAFFPWAKTGVSGSGHDKPWWYWAQLIAKSDPVVMVSAISSLLIFFFKISQKTKWILIFAWINFAIYSFIPYKTPWCVISITWPFLWLGASFLNEVISNSKKRTNASKWLSVVYIFGMGFSTQNIYQSALKQPFDLHHPFVYVNGSEEMRRFHLVLIESGLIDRTDLKAQIAITEYWPFPWLLRNWGLNLTKLDAGFDVSAVMFACNLSDAPLLESKMLGKYWKMKFATRQDITDSYFYVRADIAEPFLKLNGEWVTRLDE